MSTYQLGQNVATSNAALPIKLALDGTPVNPPTAPAEPAGIPAMAKNLTDFFPTEAMTFYLAVRGFAPDYGGDSWIAKWWVLILIGSLFNVVCYLLGVWKSDPPPNAVPIIKKMMTPKVALALGLSVISFFMWSLAINFDQIPTGIAKMGFAIALAATVAVLPQIKDKFLK